MTPTYINRTQREFHRVQTEARFILSAGLVMIFILFAPLSLPADHDNSISIASIYSLTGPAARSSWSSVRGVRMAVKEINAAGGLLGLRLKRLNAMRVDIAINLDSDYGDKFTNTFISSRV